MKTVNFPLLHRFRLARDGSTLAEFAIMMPILTTLLLASVDLGRLALLQQKLDQAAATIGDDVSQIQGITSTQLNDVFQSVGPVIQPFPIGPGVAIVSFVTATGTSPPVISWQQSGGGGLSVKSLIGNQGGTPKLPTGFTVQAGQSVVVAESFYDFAPIFLPDLFVPRQLYHVAFYRPRY